MLQNPDEILKLQNYLEDPQFAFEQYLQNLWFQQYHNWYLDLCFQYGQINHYLYQIQYKHLLELILPYYEYAFVIAPVICQVTDAVANSPTPPFNGVHSETNALNEYDGAVALTVEVGEQTIVVAVPNNG